MRRSNVFILLLSTATLFAQDGLDEIRQSYNAQAEQAHPYLYHNDFGVAPWQSVRLISHSSYQLDILGTAEELAAVDIMLVQRDLQKVWFGGTQAGFELLDRGYKVRFHTSIGMWPLQRWHNWSYGLEAYDPENCPSPCGGWTMEILENGILYARKKISDDLYQVSFPQFLKNRSGPRY